MKFSQVLIALSALAMTSAEDLKATDSMVADLQSMSLAEEAQFKDPEIEEALAEVQKKKKKAQKKA